MNNLYNYRRSFFLILTLLYGLNSYAQEEAAAANFIDSTQAPQAVESAYEQAYKQLVAMLTQKQPYSLKEAVFAVENAYFDQRLSYERFSQSLALLAKLSKRYAKANPVQKYEERDEAQVNLAGAIFKVLTDTTSLMDKQAQVWYHLPYTYDFQDVWGEQEWVNTFVVKLLTLKSGNCHSLPLLYKLVAEELDVPAYLALAPNHMYIKQRSLAAGWYNTELTSATFPMDAWLSASGYIHTDAIRNRVYMDTLSQAYTLALCLVDLAQGYAQKKPADHQAFVLKCLDLALAYYPHFAKAMVLKADVLSKELLALQAEYGVDNIQALKEKPTVKPLYTSVEQLYIRAYKLGYRNVTKEMYVRWLQEMQNAQLNNQKP